MSVGVTVECSYQTTMHSFMINIHGVLDDTNRQNKQSIQQMKEEVKTADYSSVCYVNYLMTRGWHCGA